MNRNIGIADKILRIVVGVLTYGLFFAGITTGIFGVILVTLGTIFLLTALVNICPLYKIFKFKTN